MYGLEEYFVVVVVVIVVAVDLVGLRQTERVILECGRFAVEFPSD